LQGVDGAVVTASFDSPNRLKVVGLRGERLGEHEAEALRVPGPIIDASQELHVPFFVGFQEVESLRGGVQLLEELVRIESDVYSNGCEELRLRPSRKIRVQGRLTPKDDGLLLRLPLCKLHDGGRLHGKKLWFKVGGKTSSSWKDASSIQVSGNMALDC